MSLEAASSGQALHQRQAFSTMAAHMLQVAGWVGTKVSFIINSLDGAKLLPKAPLAHGLTVLRSTGLKAILLLQAGLHKAMQKLELLERWAATVQAGAATSGTVPATHSASQGPGLRR